MSDKQHEVTARLHCSVKLQTKFPIDRPEFHTKNNLHVNDPILLSMKYRPQIAPKTSVGV